MARELFNWGLKSATNATDEARARGLSIELVQELWREAGESDYAAGMLANWLTGQKPLPLDQTEFDRRRTARDTAQAHRAQGIRERVTAAGEARNVPPEVIAATVGRRLREAGSERFATDAERDAAARMDAADRRKQRGRKVGRIGSMLTAVD